MEIAVTGSTGLIGRALVERLRSEGHHVLPVIRPSSDNVVGDPIRWDPYHDEIEAEAFEGIDAVIHLAGEGIGEKRWSTEQKRRILDSRTITTALLAETLAGCSKPPAVFLSGSAIGYYGDTGDTPTDESGAAGDDFPAKVCGVWEATTTAAEGGPIRVAHLRTGSGRSPKGGALARQLTPFKLGLGGRAGSGRQYMSWIHIDDEVDAIVHLLQAEESGPVNLTAPDPVTNSEFTKALGGALNRPTTVLPMFGPRMLFGRELADSLLLTSQRVIPNVLEDSGFTFSHPAINEAFADLLG
ncbi:MAG: TIGR01777 family oxidoreductase [Microthrixaceae bacterium]